MGEVATVMHHKSRVLGPKRQGS